MKNKCIINQPFGIGDIMFIEPIMRDLYIKGNEIILPCLEQYHIFQRNFPYINFVSKESIGFDYDGRKIIKKDNITVYPLRWSKEYFNSGYYETMSNKYKMFDLPLEKWREFTFLRHRCFENNLISQLGVDLSNDYTLVVNKYHSYKDKTREIKLEGKNIVELKPIDGYTLLDWATIIENASAIHSVNTSTLYLFETLNLKAGVVHLYSRNDNGEGFKNTEYLRTKNYILHD